MNLIFLIFLLLFVRSDAKCRSHDFKPLLEPEVCRCNDLTYSPLGRILNGTTLDSRDAPYVAAIYFASTKRIGQFELKKEFTIFCSGAIISPRFVLS